MTDLSPPTVLTRRWGRIGHILLNRPTVLNALDLAMIEAVSSALAGWRDDPGVHAVVIEGAGGRSFCAGGDIRAVRTASIQGRREAIAAFFSAEYALNQAIADFPKPYVALIGGICMGGGLGLSVHGSMRVVTAQALFAMPETGIGLFPDIGATYFLPRLRGRVGMYMALTGARLTGADATYVGLATHFTTAERLAGVASELAEHGVAALNDAEKPPAAPIAGHMDAIDRCFAADSVVGVIERLAAEDSEWSRQTLLTLRAMSPSAVLWTFEVVRAGAGRTLPECLAAELALTGPVTAHPDFLEGVRAMVIDKDRQPRWSCSSVEAVDPAGIAALFTV